MGTKKKETNNTTDTELVIQKLFLAAFNEEPKTVLLFDYSLPLTDAAKKTITSMIDDNLNVSEITQDEHALLLKAEPEEVEAWPRPTDEQRVLILKMVDYEHPHRLERFCSEFFDHEFTPVEFKSMASEFAEASNEKTRVESNIKSYTQMQKAKVEELSSTIKRISEEMSRGRSSECVKCQWVMNEPKRNVKSLYRLDREPKDLVRTAPMLPSDRQLTLDDLAEKNAVKERTLDEKPITAVENEPYEGEILTDKQVSAEMGN